MVKRKKNIESTSSWDSVRPVVLFWATFSISSIHCWRSIPKSMKVHSMPSRAYSSCSSTNMWWLKNCWSFSLVKLIHNCSNPTVPRIRHYFHEMLINHSESCSIEWRIKFICFSSVHLVCSSETNSETRILIAPQQLHENDGTCHGNILTIVLNYGFCFSGWFFYFATNQGWWNKSKEKKQFCFVNKMVNKWVDWE